MAAINTTSIVLQGVDTSASDYAAKDGTLAISQNAICEDGGIESVSIAQNTVLTPQEGEDAVFIHHNAGYTHYVCVEQVESATALYYYDGGQRKKIGEVEGVFSQCEAIGNILIALTDKKMHYYLWDADNEDGAQYIDLGTGLPDIDIRFTNTGYFTKDGDLYGSGERSSYMVVDKNKTDDNTTEKDLRAAFPGRLECGRTQSVMQDIGSFFDEFTSDIKGMVFTKPDKSENGSGKNYPELFSNACYAALNSAIEKAKESGQMVMPRLIRAAWRLYDGTYAKQTTPVMVFGVGTRGDMAVWGHSDPGSGTNDRQVAADIFPYTVDYLLYNDMEKIRKQWGDIIKGITFFLSSDIFDYDGQKQVEALRATYNRTYVTGYVTDNDTGQVSEQTSTERRYQAELPRPLDKDMIEQARNPGGFFRAYDIDTDSATDVSGDTARYALVDFRMKSEWKRGPMTFDIEDIKKHTVTIEFSDFGEKGKAQEIAIEILANDHIENICHTVEEAVKKTGVKVDTFVMYRSRLRTAVSEVREAAAGIAIVGRTGPVVIKSISTSEDDKEAAGTLDVTGLNAYGAPLPSDRLPLGTLETQVSVSDDYWGSVDLLPAYIRAYNSRQSMGDITVRHRGVHAAWTILPGYVRTGTEAEAANLDVTGAVYYIRTDEGEIVTRTLLPQGRTAVGYALGHYLYYPDTRCFKAVLLLDGGKAYLELPMKPSSTMSGAVFAEKMPYFEAEATEDGYAIEVHFLQELRPYYTGSAPTLPEGINEGEEHLHNNVLTTYVDNPFNWSAKNVTEAGDGRVIALCPNTMAIEQEQFGKTPLYAFTDEGVWGMSVGTDGEMVAVQPVTRDVILDKESLLQIDTSILFATARGIMELTGRTSALISTAIEKTTGATANTRTLKGFSQIIEQTGLSQDYLPADDEDIKDYVKGCRMVYDYPNRRIIVYRPDKKWAYVYSLKSKQWGMTVSNLRSTLNSYPDAVCTTTAGTVINLSSAAAGTVAQSKAYGANSANEEEAMVTTTTTTTTTGEPGATVTTEPSGAGLPGSLLLLTRPMHISHIETLKTVYRLFVRGKIRAGHISVALWGSRNLWEWNLVGSSVREYLTQMAGSPYTFFVLAVWGELTEEEVLHLLTVSYREKYNLRPRANNDIE